MQESDENDGIIFAEVCQILTSSSQKMHLKYWQKYFSAENLSVFAWFGDVSAELEIAGAACSNLEFYYKEREEHLPSFFIREVDEAEESLQTQFAKEYQRNMC